jgi:hypothetical protein
METIIYAGLSGILCVIIFLQFIEGINKGGTK